MKVTITQDFYDLTAFTGRRAGEVLEVPEDRGARLIEMRLAKAEGAMPEKAEKPKEKPEKAEAPKAKQAEKTAAKKTVKKTDPKASA